MGQDDTIRVAGVIERAAAVARCKGPRCTKDLGNSPSDDFCCQKCQQRWHERGAHLLPDSAPTGQTHRWGVTR
jgi:hypothetical protein